MFGANDLISGLGSINNALINKRASDYNVANEYIRQLITEEVRQPNVGKGINPLREGMSGLNLPDWVYTTANSTSFVAGVGAEPYKILLTPAISADYNTKAEYAKQRAVFINDGTPMGTVKSAQMIIGNEDISQIRTYIPHTGEMSVQTIVNSTGQVFNTVIPNVVDTNTKLIPYSGGSGYKTIEQIENSVNNTFGEISRKYPLSPNNLLTEYSVEKSVPIIYNQSNYTLLGTTIEINPNRYVKSITAPIDYNHTFNLEINRRRNVVGGHTTLGNVIEGKIIETYPGGVYKAEVFMQDPNNPSNLLKKVIIMVFQRCFQKIGQRIE